MIELPTAARERARPLPEHDPEIDALDPETRAVLAEIWERRARSELETAAAFAVLLTELHALSADRVVLELAARATSDELRHAELCRMLASAYAGRAVEPPRAERARMPAHRGAGERTRMLLHVVGGCCINETLAVAFVESCLETSTAPLVTTIARGHLEDEIRHARVGWAHLASAAVTAADRAALAPWIERLIGANARHWHARIDTLPEHGVPGHAYPPRSALHLAVDRCIAEVVRPGFAHVGVSPAATG